MLIAVILVVGVALIVFQKSLVKLFVGPSKNLAVLAHLENVSGEAFVKSADSNAEISVGKGDAIHDQDMVSFGGIARIRFNSGLSVEVDAHSQLFFEVSDGIFVTIKSGNYRVAKTGSAEEKILFIRDGIVEDPNGRPAQTPLAIVAESGTEKNTEKSVEKNPEMPAPESSAEASENPIVDEEKSLKASDTLSDEQISRIMMGQRSYFRKCYTQHLKTNPSATGQMYFSFVIAPQGSIGQIRPLKTTIPDTDLERCVTSVIERIRFASFKGDPIVVNYPIFFQ